MRLLIVTAVITLLAGCATSLQKQTHTTIDAQQAQIEAMIQEALTPPPAYEVVDEEYVDVEVVVEEPAAIPMPAGLSLPVSFVVANESLPTHYLRRISEQSGVKLSLAPDINLPSDAPNSRFAFSFDGSAAQALDVLCATAGLTWEYDQTGVSVYRYRTQVWSIASFSGTATKSTGSSSSTQSGGVGGGGGGVSVSSSSNTGQQNTSFDTTMNILQDVGTSLNEILDNVGSYHLSESTGILSVTSTPAKLTAVDRYVNSINELLTKQALIDVRIYTVDINESDAYGVDWSLLYESLNGRYGVSSNIATDITGPRSVFTFSVIDPNYNYGGSDVFIDALADQGKSARRQNAGAMTLNYQPVGVHVGEDITILSSPSSIVVGDNAVQTSQETEVITDGFTLTIYPVILPDSDEVLLEFSLSLTDVRDVSAIESNGFVIERPRIGSRNFLDRGKLKSGETVVLGGFDGKTFQSNQRGLTSPKAWFLGGSTRNNITRTQLVVTITPHII